MDARVKAVTTEEEPLLPILAVAAEDPVVLPQQGAATVADLALAGLYIPAGVGAEPIAGDFFEVLPLGDVVALLVGDVAGHGRAAVGRMRELRAAARQAAQKSPGPAQVLALLDRMMDSRGDEDAFATLWYGEYRPASGELTYASAGHPPPAVHAQDAVVLLAEADAPSLGTGLAHALAVERTVLLPDGAVLVAYSDGLIERRGADLDRGFAELLAVVTRACDPTRPGTAESIASEILQALVPLPDQAEDDVCVLVVRRQRSATQAPAPTPGASGR